MNANKLTSGEEIAVNFENGFRFVSLLALDSRPCSSQVSSAFPGRRRRSVDPTMPSFIALATIWYLVGLRTSCHNRGPRTLSLLSFTDTRFLFKGFHYSLQRFYYYLISGIPLH